MGVEITLSPNGRIVIPADVRKRLGLEKGGKLILDVDDYGVTLSTAQQRVRKAQARYRDHLKMAKPDTVAGFLKQKRQDAEAENSELGQ